MKSIVSILSKNQTIKNIGVNIAQKQALKKIEEIVNNTTDKYPEIEKPKKIIFNRAYTTYAQTILNEVAIAKALQLKGHEVKFYFCGGKLWNCSAVFTITDPPNKNVCKNCIYFGKNLFSICKIPFETYGDMVKETSYKIPDNKDDMEEIVYKGICIGKHAKDSANRFYRGLNPEKSKWKYEDILRQRLINAFISLDAAEQSYKKEKPDILYTSHGCYSEWGGFTDYYRKKGVKCVVFNYSYKGTYIFDSQDFREKFSQYLKNHKELSKNEKKEITDYLSNRTIGDRDTKRFNYDLQSEHMLKDFLTPEYEHVFAIFPNVPWDASLVKSHKAFKDVYEWIDYTINYFKKHPRYLLMIKIHPGEIIDGSLASVKNYIDEKYAPLTDNIKIIDAGTKISPYVLIKAIDTGIVYNGTLGLEMAIQGIPVILAGLGHYGGHGFTNDSYTKEEYRAHLDNPPKKLDTAHRRLAENYAHFYFIKSVTPRGYVIHKNKLLITYDFNKFEELLKRQNIQKICKYILEDVLFQEIES